MSSFLAGAVGFVAVLVGGVLAVTFVAMVLIDLFGRRK